MSDLLLHPTTETSVAQFVAKPSHALLLLAPTGAGKTTVALHIASQLLHTDVGKLANHPYFKLLNSPDNKAISIDSVRTITHFLSLKTTGRDETGRMVIIEHAQLMTPQAQNALLKTIEEPPLGTVIILTAPSELGILPTILSRIQKLPLRQPETEAINVYFATDYSQTVLHKALTISDGLLGLTTALLASDTTHPLVAATSTAHSILQKTTFERLTMLDDIAKDKQHLIDTLFILSRMADISLRNSGSSDSTVKRWHRILSACHEAQKQLLASAQTKLVLLNFMLVI